MPTVSRAGLGKFLPLIGGLVIGVVVLVSYHPALPIGFWYDDYNHLEMAGRPTLAEFLVNVFDPRVPRLWYRPLQQLQWRIEYTVWGGDALPYHFIQNLMHLINCWLLYGLIARLSRNWRAGFIGALLYGVLPTYTLSVFWLGVPDPLVSLFYLLTMWLWVDYLERGGKRRYALTYGAFVAAFLAKELAVFLPIILWLIDRWLVAQSAPWRVWIKRNAPFFLFLPIHLWLDWSVYPQRFIGAVAGQTDWRQLFLNVTYYVASLALPWFGDSPVKYLFLLALGIGLLYAVLTRRRGVLFLGVAGVLTLIPNLNFVGVSPRHLYLALMAPLAGLGLLIAGVWDWLYAHISAQLNRHVLTTLLVLGLGGATLWQSWTVAELGSGFVGVARQTRLHFRPIFQRHATFEPGTLLYFIEPLFSSYNVSGLMFLRYGSNVSVRANDYAGYADLRRSAQTYVFYPNEQNELQEVPVDFSATASASPTLPAQFGSNIRLEGFEVVNTRAQTNQAIILILYWHAIGKIEQDYTIFAHLVDEQGREIASYDSQPHRGATPTSTWKPDGLVADAIIIPINSDIPPGPTYRIKVGLYYLPTLERLRIYQSNTATEYDAITFSPFTVMP